MGFLDKIKEGASEIKEQNKGFGAATKRMNNGTAYGQVNRGIKDGDFPSTAYIGIENGKGLIFGSGVEDYVFTGSDIAFFEPSGAPQVVAKDRGQDVCTLSYLIKFKDGKKAVVDMIAGKLAELKLRLDLF